MPQSTPPPAPFEIGSFALAPKFPALRFNTQAEFRDYIAREQSLLDARYEYEISLATREPRITRPGTCAPCLRAARFTSQVEGGETLRDGTRVPNWREAMQCDCRDGLSNRQRALLHFAQATGILPWTRLLLVGAPAPADMRLAELAAEVVTMRPIGSLTNREGFHMAVSHDYLHHVPRLDAALADLQARLLDGGRFIFTVPFYHDAAASELIDLNAFAGHVPPEIRGKSHRLGWDILERVRAAGFREAAAYLYWSEELGYLGPMNFIFRAVK